MTTTATAVGARLFHSSKILSAITLWRHEALGIRQSRGETFTPTKLAAVKVNYTCVSWRHTDTNQEPVSRGSGYFSDK